MSNAARRRARRSSKEPAPISQLHEVVVIIGDAFGADPACVEAAVLLESAGRLLGYDLTVRPVSFLAEDERTNRLAIFGEKAAKLLPPEALAQAHDTRPLGQEETGHVIVTCEDPAWLFDPNLRQLGAFGIKAPSAAMPINSVSDDGGWTFRHDGLTVRYLLDESSRGLLKNHREVSRMFEQDAIDVVRHVRAGGTANDYPRPTALA